MERWANKVALVTGAASGIGAQFCKDLCAHNVTVIGLDFNEKLLKETAAEIKSDKSTRFSTIHCDLTDEQQIQAAFERVSKEYKGVDILVNCAGMFPNTSILQEDGHASLMKTVQTNLLAVISCTRKAYKSMNDRDVEGHIVNMCSVAGHVVQQLKGVSPATSYYVTKSAVKTLNQMIGQELVFLKNTKVRYSNISPGLVGGTNILKDTSYQSTVMDGNEFKLKPKDISDTLLFILSTPKHVQVRDVIIESVGACLY